MHKIHKQYVRNVQVQEGCMLPSIKGDIRPRDFRTVQEPNKKGYRMQAHKSSRKTEAKV